LHCGIDLSRSACVVVQEKEASSGEDSDRLLVTPLLSGDTSKLTLPFSKNTRALRVVNEKVSLRTLEPPKREFDRMRELPEDDPVAVAVIDKWLASITVFGLGRVIAISAKY
jgi:hypothetical protein